MKFSTVSAVLVSALWITQSSQAAVISVEGNNGQLFPGDTGVLEIQFNTFPENRSFMNGGIGLALTLSSPGVIEFTDATVINGGRWAVVVNGAVTPTTTGTLNAFSLSTPGLPSGFDVVFATVGFKVVGFGLTQVIVAPSGEDPLFDGSVPPFGADVSREFTFQSAIVGPMADPEPSSIVLAILGCLGWNFRRSGFC